MKNNDFPIIGIGASAGGLEPLEVFFRNINNEAGIAYLIVQHLAPHHKSLMDELLSRHTSLPISIMQDGMEIEKNHIYLNPPQRFVGLENKTIKLFEKEDKQLSYPITSFFHSLADQWEDKACGVILSGTGSDGSEGIRFVKEKGGLVLVQNPKSAKFDGMPKNAIASGCADNICEAENMPSEIERFFKTQIMLQDEETQSKDTVLISLIVNIVLNNTGIDFSGYKISTVQRRITKRMSVAGYVNLGEYYEFMKSSGSEAQVIAKELLIGVTRFFRDEEAFEAIKTKVIPQLVKQAESTKTIRIWVTACSTGEEAYSLAIIIKEYLKKNNLQCDVSIFATDLDNEAIKTAGNRVFPESIATEVSREILQSYFIPSGRGFRIAREIRDMIIFSAHNLIQDPPFSRIDLVTCRNFLIYLKTEVQEQIFSLFRFTLRPDGFLFLGYSESLGNMAEHFQEFDKKNKIYINTKRIHVPHNQSNKGRMPKIRLHLPGETIAAPLAFNYILQNSSSKRFIEGIHRFLIKEYVPDSVVFTNKYEIIHTTGHVNEWLKLPSGEMTFNVLRMLPQEWMVSFEIAANRTIQNREDTLLKNVKVPDNLIRQKILTSKVNIRFKALPSVDESQQITVASFEKVVVRKDHNDGETAEIDLNLETRGRLILMEQELQINKENLQTTIEELESSNEELQAANEELQSSNEELESVNEELYTVNSEYQAKVDEMASTTNDIKNLLTSTDIAILFLDEQLNIRRYTPAIKDIFNLLPQDVGRHIIHFRGSLQLENFIDEIEKVHKTLIPFETAILSISGNNYMMRISPFRTEQNEIKGIVISFTNITNLVNVSKKFEFSQIELSKLNEKYREQAELFEVISNNASDLISVNLPDGTVEYISPSLREITSYQPEELLGKSPFEYIHQSDKENFSDKFFSVVKGEDVGLVEFRIRDKNDEYIWLESSLRPILSPTGKVIKVLNTARDITLRKFYNNELKKLSIIAKQTTNGVITTDEAGQISFVNEGFEKLSGFLEEEVLGKKPGSFLQGEETDPAAISIMQKAIGKKERFDVEIINYHKDGGKYWIKIHCEPIIDEDGNCLGFFSLQTEITQQKEYELQIEKLNGLLKTQNYKLEDSNKMLEEFAYIASHDLKEPLRIVNIFLGQLQNKYADGLDEKAHRYIHFAQEGASRMGLLIDELLVYSTLNVETAKEEVNTEKIINEVVLLLSGILEEKQGSVTFDFMPVVNGLPTPLRLVFQNLIGNALKYQKKGVKPVVTISAREVDKQWQFEIKDNGIGIGKEYQNQIFKMFKRLHTKDEYAGTGMGLATCKKIVEQHGGQIWVESEEGEGSCFYFTIPFREEADEQLIRKTLMAPDVLS